MSAFLDAMTDVEDGIDEAFGETVLVTPMTSSEYFQGTPDESNPPFDFIGIADIDGQTMGVTGTRYKAKMDANLRGFNSVVSTQVASLNGRKLKNGDKLELTDRTPVMSLVVGDTRPDGLGRIHIYVEVTRK